MNLTELTELKESQVTLYQKIHQANKNLQAAIKLHEKAARNYQALKLSYESNDRLIAEEEIRLRNEEIAAEKAKAKKSKAPTNSSWAKVLKAIEALPAEQQAKILANIEKEE